MNRQFATLGAFALLSAASGCGDAHADLTGEPADAVPLHAAVQQITDVIIYDIMSPPQASRVYAYASIAAYEALRHGDSTYRSLAGTLNDLAPPPAPPARGDSAVRLYLPVAGVHAFMTVGRALTFSRARMDLNIAAMRQRYMDIGLPAPVVDSSIAYGERVARHILDWASKDGFLQTRGYPKFSVTSERGRWVPTPPAYMDAVEPNWARHRPFLLDSAGQYRPPPPHPFDTAATSAFHREAREVYDISRALTKDQEVIYAFWDDNPYVMNVRGHAMFATKKMSPGGHWMGITGIAARMSDRDMLGAAAAYARVAVALADGFISCWEEKFRSNVMRPETYINAYIDESWTPRLQTPPFPEYTSGHSVISTAAAEVLTDEFGDRFAYADTTETPYGLPVREFASFRDAAAEAAMSRIYGGIHFRRAVEQGVLQGRRVGEHVVRRLRPRGTPAIAQAADAPTRRGY